MYRLQVKNLIPNFICPVYIKAVFIARKCFSDVIDGSWFDLFLMYVIVQGHFTELSFFCLDIIIRGHNDYYITTNYYDCQ